MPFAKRLILAALATLLAVQAHATTIQSFSFEQLADEAECIFQGRVLDVRADEGPDGLIYTWVRFRVDEVVKGAAGGELELRFLGGEIADRKVSVSEMHLPEEGETGLYFVESLNAGLVNPLLGWWQGHFRIQRQGDGTLTVTDARGRNPASLLAGEAPSTPAGKRESLKQGRSVRDAKAVTLDDFKQAIRERLEEPAR